MRSLLTGIGLLIVCFVSRGQTDHWETVVYEYDMWHYDVPTSAVDPTWNTLTFNDAAWLTGPGGFGYGDSDDNTVITTTVSCYQRIQFTITDTAAITRAVLDIDYDDGFVAYLNGVEITRANITSTGAPAFNQLADGNHEAEVYQGLYPLQYNIDKSFLSANLQLGQNVLAVQTHNVSGTSSDMTSRLYFSVGIGNTSFTYGTPPSWFVPPFEFNSSNLPIIILNTFSQPIPDEPKITATMGIINNGSGLRNYLTDFPNEYNGYIGIERRGSSSGGFAKKSYSLETRDSLGNNNNVPIFGMPPENDWVLYAPYSDKSLMRNVLTYKLGNVLGEYAPRTQFCEVVLNGEYVGVYVFMEKIKRDVWRVDIAKLNYIDTIGDQLTGGYILKIDKTTGGGIAAWSSPFIPWVGATQIINYQMHYPDLSAMHPSQLQYIQNYVTSFETALDGSSFTDPVNGYLPYINRQSFIDFFIINEISKNVDGYRLSTYLFKDRDSFGGKLTMGPLWDFNLAFGNANYYEGWITSGWEIDFENVGAGDGFQNPFWWKKFVQDTTFNNELRCRWEILRLGVLSNDSILNYIDSTAALLGESQQRNFEKWPVLGTYIWPNYFIGNTYAEEITYLKDWITQRMSWLDSNMFGNCYTLNTPNLSDNNPGIKVYPNPFSNQITISYDRPIINGTLTIYNIYGQLIKKINNITDRLIIVNRENLLSGIYFYRLTEGTEVLGEGKIIAH